MDSKGEAMWDVVRKALISRVEVGFGVAGFVSVVCSQAWQD